MAQNLLQSSAVMIDGDEYPQWVVIGRVTETGANTLTLEEVTDRLAPEIHPNAYGKGDHGLLVWEVFGWFSECQQPDNEAGQANTVSTRLWQEDTDATPTAMPNIAQNEVAWSRNLEVRNLQSAAGESANYSEQSKYDLIGTVRGQLLIGRFWWLGVLGTGNALAKTGALKMFARRVTVPLVEAIADLLGLEVSLI